MTEDKKFIDGFFVKEPTRDFIKCSISIKKADFADWFRNELKTSDDDWINIDVKEGKSGKWYAEQNMWRPDKSEKPSEPKNDGELKSLGQTIPEDIPF
tara:strand:- start:2691 stop:2984 length:294 start_codon:yes stop_codon:yes gene_type:complete